MSEIEVIDLCIVCNKLVSSNDPDTKNAHLESGQGSEEGYHDDGNSQHEFSRSSVPLARETETDLLLPQLRVIFLLKQFFKVPLQEESATVQMLGDPVKWCEICRNCQVLVDTGIDLLRKIRKCEEAHQRVLGELERKFELSNNIEHSSKNHVIVRKENARRREFRNRVRDALLPICFEIKNETEPMLDPDDDWNDPMDDTAFETLDWTSTCNDEKMWDQAKEADNAAPSNVRRRDQKQRRPLAKKEPPKRPVKKPPRPMSKYQRLKNAQEQGSSTIELIPEEDIKEETDPVEGSKEPWSLDAPLDSPSGLEVIHDEGGDDTQKEIESIQEMFKDPNYRPGSEGKLGSRSRLNAQLKKVAVVAKRLKRAKMMRRAAEERALKPKRPCKKKPPPQDVESGQKFSGAETKLEKLRIPRTGTCSTLEEREVRKGNFPCPVCPKQFSHKYFAIAHIQRVHFGILKPWKCNQCQHTASRFKRFMHHLTLHEGGGLKLCLVCDFSSQRADVFQKHVVDHEKDVESPSCWECDKTFSDFRTYLNHMTETHGYSIGNSAKMCEYCSFTTQRSKTLDFHRLVKHNVGSNDGRFPICSDCGQMFSCEANLTNHIAITHNANEGSYCCEFCGKDYKRKDQLSYHVKSAHTNPPDVEPIPCRICGMTLLGIKKHRHHTNKFHPETKSMSVEELEEYVKKKNEEEKTFQCNLCVENFSFHHLLYHHYRTCHPEVTDKFKCTVCGKGFSRQCSVKRHYESAHMKLKLSCDLCGRECTSRDGMAQHKSKYCPVLKKQQEQEQTSTTQATTVGKNPEDGKNVFQLNEAERDVNSASAIHFRFPHTINIPFENM